MPTAVNGAWLCRIWAEFDPALYHVHPLPQPALPAGKSHFPKARSRLDLPADRGHLYALSAVAAVGLGWHGGVDCPLDRARVRPGAGFVCTPPPGVAGSPDCFGDGWGVEV